MQASLTCTLTPAKGRTGELGGALRLLCVPISAWWQQCRQYRVEFTEQTVVVIGADTAFDGGEPPRAAAIAPQRQNNHLLNVTKTRPLSMKAGNLHMNFLPLLTEANYPFLGFVRIHGEN
ncbi:hypothetical protein E2C01_025461 [Portunus trituberculatus]|uniref:Uncharacterized protein n=1 Tax=Portunus trituberculatus TaxID=210409 RepID=A0A5B7EFN5_PORTR|nr:hypothetical protein [Portunus trituberculatus]